MATEATPAWLIYERCVASQIHENYGGLNTVIQPNVMIRGSITDINRQIDVLIDSRWDADTTKRIIVDAKQRKRKVNVNDVESFLSMMEDCVASHGILVCTNGYSPAAFRRAQDEIKIQVLTLDEAQELDWTWEPCLGKCNSSEQSHTKRGMVLWTEVMPYSVNGLWMIVQTGKCDGCHSFHIWCWDCGMKFAVPDKTIVCCDCERYWSSVPESKASGHVGTPTSIWLMMKTDLNSENSIAIDRRPIR